VSTRDGRRAREEARTADAQEAYRRVLVDSLAEHPDVFRYLAEQAAELAGDFPEGSREHITLRLFDQAAREVALMLERAEMVKAAAS
jgi:hypothetical protein